MVFLIFIASSLVGSIIFKMSENLDDLNKWLAQSDFNTLFPEESNLDCSLDVDTSNNENTSDVSDLTSYEHNVVCSHMFEADGKNSKVNRCIVTIFPPNSQPDWLLPEFYFEQPKIINNWCGQFEICPTTNELHAHIYIEFAKSRIRFNSLRKIFSDRLAKNCDIVCSRKSNNTQRQCAVNYVLDPTKRAPDCICYIWPSNKNELAFDPDARDKRGSKPEKESEFQRLWIESRPRWWTWDQIVHENEHSKKLLATCTFGAKYHAGRHAETERRIIKDVIIMYGAGGTGKTTFAQAWDIRDGEDFMERYYRRNTDDGQFWGGGRTAYRGQRIIHMEEFCGQEPFHRIKEICDIGKSGPSVNIKKSGTDLNHDTVIFTSNHHPGAWYKNVWGREPKQFYPFWRRITQVWFFPAHRADGSLNIPSEDTPPYYVDQTEAWLAMQGDYDICVNHAREFWPISDQEVSFTEVEPNPAKQFFDYCKTGRSQLRGD